MSYTVNYSHLPEAEKRERALADARAWLDGREEPVQRYIRECSTLSQAIFGLDMVGIKGLPALVYAQSIRPEWL